MPNPMESAYRTPERDRKRLRTAEQHDQVIGPESRPGDIGTKFSGPPIERKAEKARGKIVKPEDRDEGMPKVKKWVPPGRMAAASKGGLAKRLRLRQ